MIRTIRYIYCDGEECRGGEEGEPLTASPEPGLTIAETMNRARQSGWVCVKTSKGYSHYCPSCAKKIPRPAKYSGWL